MIAEQMIDEEKARIQMYCTTYDIQKMKKFSHMTLEDIGIHHLRQKFTLDVPGNYYVYSARLLNKKPGKFIVSKQMDPNSQHLLFYFETYIIAKEIMLNIKSIKNLISSKEGLTSIQDKVKRFQLITPLRKPCEQKKEIRQYYPPIMKNYDTKVWVLLQSIGQVLVEPRMRFQFGTSFKQQTLQPGFTIQSINYLYELKQVLDSEILPISNLPTKNQQNLLHLEFPEDGNENEKKQIFKCRICMDFEDTSQINNTFINPCNCKGDGRYMHIFCISNWARELLKRKDQNSPLACELCHGALPQYIGIVYKDQNVRPRYFKFIQDLNKPYMEIAGLGKKQMNKGTMRIGTGDENWLRLSRNPGVDEIHAVMELIQDRKQVYIQDESKKNGTYYTKQDIVLRVPRKEQKSRYQVPTIKVKKTLFGFKAI